jgi:hypothetical protein
MIRKLGEVDRLLGQGADVAEAARHLEVSEQTYHRWRNRRRRGFGSRERGPGAAWRLMGLVEGGVRGVAGGAPQYSSRRFDFFFAKDRADAGEVMRACDGVGVAHGGTAVVAHRDCGPGEVVLGGAVVTVHEPTSSIGKNRRRAHSAT